MERTGIKVMECQRHSLARHTFSQPHMARPHMNGWGAERRFNVGPCPDAGIMADFPQSVQKLIPINGRKSIPQSINCARRKACLYVREGVSVRGRATFGRKK